MAKYMSNSPNQVLCIRPARTEFINGIPNPIPGDHVRFERGEYETDDEEKIGFIEKHRLFGTSIVRLDEPKGKQSPKVPAE